MATKNEEKWVANYEALKAHVLKTGHFCDKHTRLCNCQVPEEAHQDWNNAKRTNEAVSGT